MRATVRTPEIGYEGMAYVTRIADQSGLLFAERYDQLIDPARMADAGRAKRWQGALIVARPNISAPY
jgi:hypothetical protein